MIYLSKFVTIFDEQHKKQKALLDKQITIMVMDLIRSSKVKHKNKAQVMAESHYDKEMDWVLDLEIILRKAEILYRSYKTFLDVAHTELRYLQKDMVQTNMHNQYANWSKTWSWQQQMSQIAKQMQQH